MGSTYSSSGRRLIAIFTVVVCLLAAGCTSSHRTATATSTPTSSSRSATGDHTANNAVARTRAVAIGSGQKVTVAPAALTKRQTTALSQGWPTDMTVNIGVPVKVSTSGRLPAGGIRLSRTYAQPLPAGVSATMAFYDEQWGAWHAVPSTLSSDRRTVTAVVHHLSLWTDITGAVGTVKKAVSDAVNSAANWAYYQVGKVFDTRVDPPSCSGKPDWVSSSVFIETDKNNPLLFCVGSDPKHASILDVKARVNRGFAYNAYLGPETDWLYNSTFSGMSLDDVVSAIGHLDDDVSQTWGLFSPKGSELVGAGKELSFGATEQQVRNLQGTSTVLRLEPPSTVGFLVSTLGRLVGTQLQLMADGYAAGAIAIAGCYSDVKAAHDAGTWTRAALTCLGNLDDATAKTLATYLTERGADPVAAGKTAGGLLGRISVYLALVGPVFSAMNFALEQRLSDSARTVNVYPQAEQVTASTLRSAEVPADCRLPAQRLKNGRTTEGSPGGGSLVDVVAYGDLAGAGLQAGAHRVCVHGGWCHLAAGSGVDRCRRQTAGLTQPGDVRAGRALRPDDRLFQRERRAHRVDDVRGVLPRPRRPGCNRLLPVRQVGAQQPHGQLFAGGGGG